MVSVARASPWPVRRATRSVALVWGACLAAAAGSLALPGVPTTDPWAWVVFGREIVGPGPGLSTISPTGWKPLAVLFTAPLALFGSGAPSLWLVVVRTLRGRDATATPLAAAGPWHVLLLRWAPRPPPER